MVKHAQLCYAFAQASDIVTCSHCSHVGRLEYIQKHFRDAHMSVTRITNTVIPVSEFIELGAERAQPAGTCKLCKYSTSIKDEMIHHATEHHMREKCQDTAVYVRNSMTCPAHGPYYMLGNFCRQCMTRSIDGNGWNCALCPGSRFSPPERHFRDAHMSRYSLSTATVYTCSSGMYCRQFHTTQQWVDHFLATHVCYTTTCPLPDCSAILTYNTTIATHFKDVHLPVYTYKKKESTNFLDMVKYRTEHIHNAIAVSDKTSNKIVYDVEELKSCNDIHELAAFVLALKCNVPPSVMWSGKRYVNACTILLRNTLVDHYNFLVQNNPCRYSYATLPAELWELVYMRLEYYDRIRLAETCRYLSQIHETSPVAKMDAMVTWVHTNNLFKFSPNGYMCATRARSTFMLTDAELQELPVTLVDNPYYRCASYMRLYDAHDLGLGIYNKYKTPEAFMAAHEKREARVLARRNKRLVNFI